ncbi:galactose-1-phosphate uridylyltransferase [Nitrosovibrio sp. Nv4]|uniref:galactose-1-phosphate uridylyltransferase n=1 Tax=Nitrosovibrio sp. Nv4 TaxID=1945880 RepID=UPI000BDA61E7|nr:galactose-1-phosphate uridylyltransferase [Nitrosovibrio sp. Nv4]SOD42212.1 UDPglucose--hexose-1-phosphate uridylyltransferase [Nitrosovibrio sp. Nv4]
MYSLDLIKPDGRRLTLYARQQIDPEITAPSPFDAPLNASPHLRWHPLRGEWVTYAAYRQGRTFLPPPEYNPLGVTTDPVHPTEVPAGNWDVAVFDNRFPSLGGVSAAPPALIVPSKHAAGHCEVVVFTKDSAASLGALPLAHIELLLQVWGDRTDRMAQRQDIAYVLPFENRGAEVGVTLHHPHGQIYAYPLVPPVPARMQQEAQRYYGEKGRGVLQDLIVAERRAGLRMLYEGSHAVAFVPACARYPYEVWVAPIEPVESFIRLTSDQRADLARALKTVLLKYDGLWQRPFPYLMAWYQAPADGQVHPESHLHAEFYPPYRTRDRLKYLAGTEIAAGFFAMDALPEEKALELQQVEVALE